MSDQKRADQKRTLTTAQREYEAKRAAKAGMSLEKWLAAKERERAAEAKSVEKARRDAAPEKPPGLLTRLLDRAHKPLR